MKKITKTLLSFVLSAYLPLANASDRLTSSTFVPPVERSYVAILPKPFNSVKVTIQNTTQGVVKSVTLLAMGKTFNLNNDVVENLMSLREPSFTYEKADIDDTKKLKMFSMKINYGTGIRRVIKNALDCGVDWEYWDWNKIIITLDSDHNIETALFEPQEVPIVQSFIECSKQ